MYVCAINVHVSFNLFSLIHLSFLPPTPNIFCIIYTIVFIDPYTSDKETVIKSLSFL